MQWYAAPQHREENADRDLNLIFKIKTKVSDTAKSPLLIMQCCKLSNEIAFS